MSRTDLSRRKFLHNVAAGSTGAALVSLPGVLAAGEVEASPEAASPLTVDSYPIAEPGKGASLEHVKIASQAQLPAAYQEKIRGISSGLELKLCRSEDEFHREISNAHILYGGFSQKDLAVATQLKWIQYTAAGVERILWPDLVESSIVLTNMQRVYAPAISETVMALLLSLARGLNRYTLQTREHLWKPVGGLTEINGLTMGIVGLGGIGTDTAYRAHYGFGMKILAVDPKPLPKPTFVAELHSLDWFPQMVPQVDVLVSAAPHTKVSERMVNESVFRAMKPSAYFINVSRGMLVDSPALIRALKEGWIAGAGLDVTHKEPLPPGEPLWDAPNLIITCHSSGHSPRSIERQMAVFSENIRRYLAGLPLLNVVDKKRGY